MKKIILAIVLAVLCLPALSLAAPTLPPASVTAGGTGIDPVVAIIEKIGNWMFAILLGVAAIFILLSAFDFLTAKGDPAAVTKARKALTYSLVAVAVAVLTRGLIEVAKSIAQGVL